ncbi:MAG: hypothetical protein ACP5QT_02740 [Brevinematia bacterium]
MPECEKGHSLLAGQSIVLSYKEAMPLFYNLNYLFRKVIDMSIIYTYVSK